MVHSEVYLNKYVVSIAPFSTPAWPDLRESKLGSCPGPPQLAASTKTVKKLPVLPKET